MEIAWIVNIILIFLTINDSECIFGGDVAEPGYFPYAVSIREDGTDHSCGGAIINNQFIISSAICMDIFPNETFDDPIIWKPRNLIALAGVVDLNDANATVLYIEEITRHPDFDKTTSLHDLALLRTKKKIDFTDSIVSIALPELDQPPNVDMFVTVAGWGYYNNVFIFLFNFNTICITLIIANFHLKYNSSIEQHYV